MGVVTDDWAAAFSQHLDVCDRCANGPFDLCAEGQRLLEALPPELELLPSEIERATKAAHR